MLSRDENELLTRVGPGTPTGELFRRFWLPVLLSEELPRADSDPLRVRILGEDLIAFRDTQGQVGLVHNNCPHRGASLFFGRNEEGGLRCVYHGWKFDASGACVDMPNELAESDFKSKVKAVAYPTNERGGLVWAYMGPPEHRPAPPDLEFTQVPDSHHYVTKYPLDCNYMQGMEGELDSSHVSFLHSTLKPDQNRLNNRVLGQNLLELTARDGHPRFTVVDSDAGLVIGASREVGDGTLYWRITQWLMPCYTLVPGDPNGTLLCQIRIPIDDEHHWLFRLRWNAFRPLPDDEVRIYRQGGGFYATQIPGSYQTLANSSNDYLIDRQKQKTVNYSGLESVPIEDTAMMESMGPIYDRGQEHLGSSDVAVISTRRRLMKLATDLREGVEPFAASHPELYRVRSAVKVLAREVPFLEGASELLLSRTGA
ncbi:MAG: Rieske 2Fe-2S domain-containing protein [Chloroflexi bacterium]|nr:Rieske 2Fe-2S domain-containing protein [Chloroflexota bacterium]